MAGISCREVARLADIPQGIVSRTERSEKGVASETLKRLSDVFGCSIDWLYLGRGGSPTKTEVLANVAKAARRSPRIPAAKKRTRTALRAVHNS